MSAIKQPITHKQFVLVAEHMHKMYDLLKQIQDLHIYRWKYFADSSPKGERCSYAVASARAYAMDGEGPKVDKLIDELYQLAHGIVAPNEEQIFNDSSLLTQKARNV